MSEYVETITVSRETIEALKNARSSEYVEPEPGCKFNIGLEGIHKLCAYTSDVDPQGCEGNFLVIDAETRRAHQCPGALYSDLQSRLDVFKKLLPNKYKNVIAADHSPHKWQLDAVKILRSPAKAAWLHGISKFGKTHLCYRAIYQRLRHASRVKLWVCVKAKKLLDAWVDQYADEKEQRQSSRDLKKEIQAADILFIDDIDKIGNYTPAREQETYSLIDYLADTKKLVYITSQLSMQEFCGKFQNERHSRESQGAGPIETRLRELCHEVEVSKPVQELLL